MDCKSPGVVRLRGEFGAPTRDRSAWWVPRRDYSTRLDFFDFPAKSNVVVHSGFGQSHTEVLVAGVQMALPHLSSLGHQSDRAALGHIHSDLERSDCLQ